MTALDRYPFAEATRGLGADWRALLEAPAARVAPAYLEGLASQDWLPGPGHLLAALHRVPLAGVKAVLIGESPYPRPGSAIGEAFNDGLVTDLWSSAGLSKPVNRATSMRNIMKMLLVTEGLIPPEARAEDIAALDPRALGLVATMAELFGRIRAEGILCVNAIPVLTASKGKDARAWEGFMDGFLAALHAARPEAELLLFGNFAQKLSALPGAAGFPRLEAEHPYNIGFITDARVQDFFRPLHLLRRGDADAGR